MHTRYLLAALIFSMALAVNAPASSLESLGVDRDILMGALVTTVLTGFFAFRDLGFICLMLILTLGANLPREVAAHYGIDTSLLMFTLGLILTVLIIHRFVRRGFVLRR